MENDDIILSLCEKIDVVLNEKSLLENPEFNKEKMQEFIDKNKEDIENFVTEFVYDLLKIKKSKEDYLGSIDTLCEMVKESGSDDIAVYLRNKLVEKLDRDFNKSIFRRKIEKYKAVIFGFFILFCFVGTKLYYDVNTNYSLTSKMGIENAIKICDKIDWHDGIVSSDVHVKNSGWGKMILAWPFNLSEEEEQYFLEYFSLLKYFIVSMANDKKICNVGNWSSLSESLSDDEMDKIFKDVKKINEVMKKNISLLNSDDKEDIVYFTILLSLSEVFPCE